MSLHVMSVKSDGASLDLVGMVSCLYQEIVGERWGVGHKQTFSAEYGFDRSSGAVYRLQGYTDWVPIPALLINSGVTLGR